MADQNVTTTNIQGFAPVIEPYASSVLGQAANLVGRDYKSYADWARERGLTGDQVAAFTGLQNKHFEAQKGWAKTLIPKRLHKVLKDWPNGLAILTMLAHSLATSSKPPPHINPVSSTTSR